MTARITLDPGNPFDLTAADLAPLREELNSIDGVSAAIASHPEKGAGVSLVEVLNMWVPDPEFFRDEAYSKIIEYTLVYLAARFDLKHAARRAKTLIVRDESTGGELDRITLDSPDAEPRKEPADPEARRVKPSTDVD